MYDADYVGTHWLGTYIVDYLVSAGRERIGRVRGRDAADRDHRSAERARCAQDAERRARRLGLGRRGEDAAEGEVVGADALEEFIIRDDPAAEPVIGAPLQATGHVVADGAGVGEKGLERRWVWELGGRSLVAFDPPKQDSRV